MHHSAKAIIGAAIVTATALLAGCSSPEGVTVPRVPDGFVACEVRSVSVTSVDGAGAAECDLAGSILALSDGTSVTVPPVGSVFVSQGPSDTARAYHLVNWGVAGLGVALVEERRATRIWASTPDARDLQEKQLQVDDIDISNLSE